MRILLTLCGVAAAEIVAQPSICIDPPPQSSNSSLDAAVARALAKLAAPSLSWQSFMRGATLADRAVSVVRVRDAPGPPVSTLIYLTTACTPCHLHYLRACWPNALRASIFSEADVLTYAGCRGATSPSAWAHALAALPVRNVTLAWTRWNPGYQEGAMAAVMVAARQGWFDSYAWVVRANPDVRIEDASFLAARLRKPTVDAVLVRCRPRAPSICTDFFAARPSAMNHSAWGRSRKKNGRVNNVPTQRPGVRASTCSVDRWRRAHRSMDAGALRVQRIPGRHRGRDRDGLECRACVPDGARPRLPRGWTRDLSRPRAVPTAADRCVSFVLVISTLSRWVGGQEPSPAITRARELAPASLRSTGATQTVHARPPRTTTSRSPKTARRGAVSRAASEATASSPRPTPKQPWASSTRPPRYRRSRPGAPPSGP